MAIDTSHTSNVEYLQDMILESSAVGDFLAELARYSARALSESNTVLCGITLLRHKKAATVASSSEQAQKMDELQYRFPDSPCVRAARDGVTIYVPEVRAERRWPTYAATVAEHGAHSILSVPFDLACEAKAALNVYGTEPQCFSADSIARTEDFAAEASKALRLALRIAEHSDMAADLKAAMESRTTINLAVGILMGQNRCTQDEAFKLLERASSNRNIKVRDLAASIVSSVGDPGPVQTHFEG